MDTPIRVYDIRTAGSYAFSAQISDRMRESLRDALNATQISKIVFEGIFESEANGDVSFAGKVGATVGQSCVVTLKPVSTRIDTKVSRLFSATAAQNDPSGETEVHSDDPEDFLPEAFDLFDLLVGILALEVPEYPRAEDAEMAVSAVTEPGKRPLTDEDVKPFAGLKELKQKLESGDDSS